MTTAPRFVELTSAQNPRVKNAVRLRDRKGRERQGRIRIDGARETLRALQAGVRLVELFVCLDWCDGPDARELLQAVDRLPPATLAPASRFSLAPDLFAKLAFGDRCDGVVAIADAPVRSLDDLQLPPVPLVAVLDDLEKPGNLGAVLRSADGAGVDAVIVCGAGADLYNPHVIRASLGVVFGQQACMATRDEALAWLRRRAIGLVAARVEGARSFVDVDLTGPVALVFGAEDRGLSDAWNGPDVTAVALPMLGAADSLNVSATAAVLFYEARRQRLRGRS